MSIILNQQIWFLMRNTYVTQMAEPVQNCCTAGKNYKEQNFALLDENQAQCSLSTMHALAFLHNYLNK
jgi:hypothetical protein